MSHIEEFYCSLLEDGRAQVGGPAQATQREVAVATEWLIGAEAAERFALAPAAPAPNREAVGWAAAMLYRAAQFVAYRDLGAELVRRDLGAQCPVRGTSGSCYGVDLAFRFLPDLTRLARLLSNADPLLEFLQQWGNEWPLSSVGISGLTAGPVDDFIDDPALRMLYVDRIISTNDVSRLSDPRASAAVAAALGDRHELAPGVAARSPAKEQAIT